jgi:protein-L-isoaspartate(D-aspartate) O-methyltransferase
MVDVQLRGRGIRNVAVLAAMATVPRERFVRPDMAERAYSDEALPIDSGQTISQPFVVAWMTELIDPRPGAQVLEIGTGSGYQAAVLAAAGCDVLSVERHDSLAAAARRRLALLEGTDRIRIVTGDGSLGRAAEAPFDGILVTAAAPRVPPSLASQLAEGGRMAVPIGSRDRQEMLLVRRIDGRLHEERRGGCVFVPLVGAEGFAPDPPSFWSWLRRL